MVGADLFYNKLNAETILGLVSDVQIISHYFKEFKLNEAICSPLRRDRSPSFSFYYSRTGKCVLYHDFGTGETGNVFTFLKKYYGIDFWQVLNMINADFGLGLRYVAEKINVAPVKIVPKEEINLQVKEPAKVKLFRSGSWSTYEINFWKSYGIDPLKVDPEIIPLGKVDVNDKFSLVSTEKDLMFGLKAGQSFKVYRPKSTFYKWLSNCTKDDVFGLSHLINTDNLENLILTKSLKDVLCLRQLGFNAFAFQSEQTIPSDDFLIRFLDWLSTKKHNKNIFVLYDNDSAGISGSTKTADYINQITLSNIKNITGVTDKQKDFSDFYLHNGREQAKQLILDSIYEYN